MHVLRNLVLLLCSASVVFSATALAETVIAEDHVSFQVEVGRDVGNDRMVAILNVMAEEKKPANLADRINSTMAWALDQARANKQVTSRSGSYQTYPVYDDRKIVRWRGRQELQLESQDVDQLSQLVGILQSRLQMQSLQFSVSPDRRRQVENGLIEQALEAYQARAEIIRKSLGAKTYKLMDINILSGGRSPVIPMRAEAVSTLSRSSVSTPALEQGTSRVNVQVSGKIRLLRD
ncbi:MAG: SIMPL domain-containing protein [Gammaproteobacteria bacterium]|nr:MAG: SIMPL domain-containing protein [Gammaproteobacteria bacterium]